MAPTFEDFIQSPQFTFYVGKERKCILVHAAAIAATSEKLDALINRAFGSASIEDVRVDDFIRFCEYAYRGDYTVPPWEEVLPEPSPSAEGNQQNGWDDGWGFSFGSRTTKKKKKARKEPGVSDWIEPAAVPDPIPEPEPLPAEEAPVTGDIYPVEESPAPVAEESYPEEVVAPAEDSYPAEVQEYGEPAPEPEPEPVKEEPSIDPYAGLSKIQKKKMMAEIRRKRAEQAEAEEKKRLEEKKAAASVEPEPVSKIQQNAAPISRTPLRTQFNGRTYVSDGGPKAHILQHFEPKPNTAEDQNFTPVLLAHARLYVFAYLRLIAPLKALTLEKLHTTLTNFNLFTKRVGDIIELARFAYSNPDVPKRKDDGTIDDLRKLVVEYIVCVIDTIGKCDEFVRFMEEGGEFVGDFWRMAREYVV